jgi:predicted ribosomally synthesized peptide with SipW-like signal peptide
MSIKKKMGAALVSTALGAALVGGGTFALFTDSAQNTGNTFAAGTLEISLNKPDGTKYFDISNIAPGDSGSATVTVKNDGTLDLRYDIAQTLEGALAQGANGLKVTIKDSSGAVITPGDTNRVLAPGASEDLTVQWTLPRDAGNEYQGASATLGITVNAEQTKNN